MEKITDQVILDLNQGEPYAFDLIFNTWYPTIFIFAETIIGNQAEAEDLVTDVFVKIYQRRQQFNTEQHIKAFLYVAARNSCLNYLKEQKRYYDLQKEFVLYIQDDTSLEYEYSIKPALVEAVRNAIEELPEGCRKVFKLLVYEELKPAEIAEQLHISINTVYAQKNRAMQALKLKFGCV